jgi:hypothetical protein
MRIASALGLGAIVAALACGDDTAGSDDDGTTGGASTSGDGDDDASADSSSSAPPDSSSAAPDDTSSTGEPTPDLEYARGIRLVRLVANQGVQIDLVSDGIEIDPAMHTSRLVSGRRTLVRAFWSLHAEFTPRELVGRLTIRYADGTELVDERTEMVEGESIDNGPSFQWLLDPDDVRDGMQIRVEALEPDAGAATGEVSDPPPVLPYAGPIDLPIHEALLEIKVVLIPVLHQFEDCEQVAIPTDEDVAAMAAQLEQNNAVQGAMLSIGEPMPYTEPIGTSGSGFSPVLAALAVRREIDDPEPNVYYYGLISPCDGFPPGLLGQAIGIPDSPTPEMANQRIAAGRWQGTGEATAETFVHEIGHTQGRRHVQCSGGEAGIDPAYPHENGRIGVWGFGIHDFQLRAPATARDYMTYCSNEWVSDYGWEQTLDTIEVLTAWDYEDVAPTSGGVLVGALHEGGTATWWTSRGAAPKATAGARIVWTIEGLEVEQPAWVAPMQDGPGTLVMSPLPEGFESATALHHEADGVSRSIAPAALRIVYRP